MNKPINDHYSATGIYESIIRALEQSGKDIKNITPQTLAPVDQFHIRGLEATRALASLSEIKPAMKVLDLGCGIGGSSRLLSSEFGCYTIGIDITEEYCRAAAKLSKFVGLDERTEYRVGDVTELPFDNESIDVVWTEHVQMNIEDKTKFYSEIYRVLKKGGKLVFHDVFKDGDEEIYFPVPWASDSSLNYLINKAEVRQLLHSLKFNEIVWEDKTELSNKFFVNVIEKAKTLGPSPLGLHILMGEDAKLKFSNMVLNLKEKRIAVLQGIFNK